MTGLLNPLVFYIQALLLSCSAQAQVEEGFPMVLPAVAHSDGAKALLLSCSAQAQVEEGFPMVLPAVAHSDGAKRAAMINIGGIESAPDHVAACSGCELRGGPLSGRASPPPKSTSEEAEQKEMLDMAEPSGAALRRHFQKDCGDTRVLKSRLDRLESAVAGPEQIRWMRGPKQAHLGLQLRLICA
ncbi:hypothetical protein HPB47_025490 [Ixodes persulcatus]|uniref:Uncharacterized protein n=1 Tax=Ixodes persulcatus TaxID=34615 RepID=A0AC60Q1Y1_IXOPE|nr:hypothetical protein HPB47_025490 [Ixodes persulcatus]